MVENIEAQNTNALDPVVLYIVVRKELNMSPGKIAAQTGHVIQKLLMHYFKVQVLSRSKQQQELHFISDKELSRVETLTHWADSTSAKIVLGATDKEFDSIKEELGKDIFVVKDAGKTEIEPGTCTVLALWPSKKSEVCKSVRGLSLLR
jgi:PTH2 family peptidyl-tRNA hydrolase